MRKLKFNFTLQTLNLSYNCINEPAIIEIENTLQFNFSLQNIKISNMSTNIMKLLKKNKQIKSGVRFKKVKLACQ